MNEPLFNLEELNSAWSDLLAQLVVSRLTIQKQLIQLKTNHDNLEIENENLKAQLSQAKRDIIAAQGKRIIDGG